MSTTQISFDKPRSRTERLRKIEKSIQAIWDEHKVFDAEAGQVPARPGDKFFGNFTYPYMNGRLHLGHAFTISKLEFAAAYHRLCGRNVLMPFAFHCTGMPIKASADKLDREITKFGNPPKFPLEEEETTLDAHADSTEASRQPGRFKSKRSKAAAKSGTIKYQWEIMKSYGLIDEEIAKFRDPYYWLSYFPSKGKEDLKAFGLGCDWRRSFITTDRNPFYDSFVQWQMRKLLALGKIVKDNRYTIFSPLDRQPCADHDRASGEGVQPQEYVLIKMEVQQPFPEKLKPLEGKNVFLAAATLRPETMYGQTNCWVLPEENYCAYEINDTDVFILTERAALNLAYQKLSRVLKMPSCLVELTGYDLIGLPLKSPLSFNEVIYSLPMLTILTNKGTGIVTSVPSDSPDDYMALHDLVSKPALRAKYGVKDEWVLPFKVIPIINIPEIGDKSAETVCTNLQIKSQNDKDKLAEAKKLTYLKGFTEGIMLVGKFKGKKVQDAKPLIKDQLVDAGLAVLYSEPETKVMSRSGDECVVALTDQWFITYGEEEWKRAAEDCLQMMNTYSLETRNAFEHTLSWLNQWACSRSFGLGTCIPWDQNFLVESLSDSTLYMAFYTVAHILQNGDMYGSGAGMIRTDQMTNAVWDFIFCNGPVPESDIPSSLLAKMKQEFEYWYPFDLRVSGKDLIQNHLIFCIYNHVALLPKHHWPRSFRCNGHLMLNSEKMSKSTGNFMTLCQAIEMYSADATRFALADAGDSMDDANFVSDTANSAVLRLTKEIDWMKEVLAAKSPLRGGEPSTYADRVFANEINFAIRETKKNYEAFMFREALKTGFYDLQAARAGKMNQELVMKFMDVQTRLLVPICPHYAEHVWNDILKRSGFVVKAGWPVADEPDPNLRKANKYLQETIAFVRKLLQKQEAGSKKGKKGGAAVSASSASKLTIGLIYVNELYDGWKAKCLNILRLKFNVETCSFAPNEEIDIAINMAVIDPDSDPKKMKKECMPFVRFKMDEAVKVGPQALDLRLPSGEMEVLRENKELLKRQLGVEQLKILDARNASHVQKAGSHQHLVAQASPGNPAAVFMTETDFFSVGAHNIV
ncbi:hypothetical protein LUZ62_068288 [Rhynchospora pubera]|uniref:leucine--tRNA ligase n=1 Tax=Rhynchospora pubera TaxID=906938 RepID=A0AAV8CUY1_9POAL|nr:hypothetical protein LUZ62_068288 [Rhynchospora pubera]